MSVALLAIAQVSFSVCTHVAGPQHARPVCDPPVETLPEVISLPTRETLDYYNPQMRIDGRVEGRVDLTCTAGEDGILRDCRVIGEQPAGKDFGKRALLVARFVPVQPATVNGTPVPRPISFEIIFPKD